MRIKIIPTKKINKNKNHPHQKKINENQAYPTEINKNQNYPLKINENQNSPIKEQVRCLLFPQESMQTYNLKP